MHPHPSSTVPASYSPGYSYGTYVACASEGSAAPCSCIGNIPVEEGSKNISSCGTGWRPLFLVLYFIHDTEYIHKVCCTEQQSSPLLCQGKNNCQLSWPDRPCRWGYSSLQTPIPIAPVLSPNLISNIPSLFKKDCQPRPACNANCQVTPLPPKSNPPD
jgi:hypothetical protein